MAPFSSSRILLVLAAALLFVAAARVPSKVTVLEFSDPGCPHCRHFTRNTFPRLSREFIETGRIQWRRHAADGHLARDMHVRVRPTFFIDGVRIEGAVPYDVFKAQLLRALRNRARP